MNRLDANPPFNDIHTIKRSKRQFGMGKNKIGGSYKVNIGSHVSIASQGMENDN
jgi:hypothetical protein